MSYHQNITRLSTEVSTEALKYIFFKFGTTLKISVSQDTSLVTVL